MLKQFKASLDTGGSIQADSGSPSTFNLGGPFPMNNSQPAWPRQLSRRY